MIDEGEGDRPVSVELDDEGQGRKELDVAVRAGHQACGQLPPLVRGLKFLEGLFEDGDGLGGVRLVEGANPLGHVVKKLASHRRGGGGGSSCLPLAPLPGFLAPVMDPWRRITNSAAVGCSNFVVGTVYLMSCWMNCDGERGVAQVKNPSRSGLVCVSSSLRAPVRPTDSATTATIFKMGEEQRICPYRFRLWGTSFHLDLFDLFTFWGVWVLGENCQGFPFTQPLQEYPLQAPGALHVAVGPLHLLLLSVLQVHGIILLIHILDVLL